MIKSITNKITNIASDEILGDALANSEDKISKPAKEKRQLWKNVEREEDCTYSSPPKKETKSNKKPKQKPPKEKIAKPTQKTDLEIPDSKIEDKAFNNETVTDIKEGYDEILSLLGIKEELNLNLDFHSDDLDYVEFSQTQPVGFDFDEVIDFISRVKYNLFKLENGIKQRNLEIKLLASEVRKIEEKMIEQNQNLELEKMLGIQTEEELLLEENVELKIQINELKLEIKELKENSGTNKKLIKEIEALRAENDIMKLDKISQTNKLPGLPRKPGTLKNEDNFKEIDSFNEMFDVIGGVYNEE